MSNPQAQHNEMYRFLEFMKTQHNLLAFINYAFVDFMMPINNNLFDYIDDCVKKHPIIHNTVTSCNSIWDNGVCCNLQQNLDTSKNGVI